MKQIKQFLMIILFSNVSDLKIDNIVIFEYYRSKDIKNT